MRHEMAQPVSRQPTRIAVKTISRPVEIDWRVAGCLHRSTSQIRILPAEATCIRDVKEFSPASLHVVRGRFQK